MTTTTTTRRAKGTRREAETRAVRLRWRTALLLALPFVIVAIGSRAFVPALGDRIARMARGVAMIAPLHPFRRAPDPTPYASPTPNADPNATSTPTPNATPNGKIAQATAAPPPGPLRIPAAKVQRAIDDAGRTIRARTTYGPDGKPMGARVTGVNGAGLGLRDGDIIIAVDGKPTLDDDAATDAALIVVARGESVLHAKMTRDGQPFDVTLELPLAPLDAGKDVR
jgi:hypothetical protein